MQKLALYLAVAAALAGAALGGTIVWGSGAQPSATSGDAIMWGT
jgi:hypothetical protein